MSSLTTSRRNGSLERVDAFTEYEKILLRYFNLFFLLISLLQWGNTTYSRFQRSTGSWADVRQSVNSCGRDTYCWTHQ